MKKLLTGLLVLGSLSTFAADLEINLNHGDSVKLNVSDCKSDLTKRDSRLIKY